MIIKGIIVCENCGFELQPENMYVSFDDSQELIRICGYCGFEVKVK
jgi:hypothetical protein